MTIRKNKYRPVPIVRSMLLKEVYVAMLLTILLLRLLLGLVGLFVRTPVHVVAEKKSMLYIWPFRGYPSIGYKEQCRRSNEERTNLIREYPPDFTHKFNVGSQSNNNNYQIVLLSYSTLTRARSIWNPSSSKLAKVKNTVGLLRGWFICQMKLQKVKLIYSNLQNKI
jgi:hypothetical protein